MKVTDKLDTAIEEAMLRLATARGFEKTICPSEVARDIGGANPDIWRPLMVPVRAKAIALAKAGKIDIRKSGMTINPDDLSGIFRIAIKPKS